MNFFFRDFIFKKTLFEKLQYLKQEQEYHEMRPIPFWLVTA